MFFLNYTLRANIAQNMHICRTHKTENKLDFFFIRQKMYETRRPTQKNINHAPLDKKCMHSFFLAECMFEDEVQFQCKYMCTYVRLTVQTI